MGYRSAVAVSTLLVLAVAGHQAHLRLRLAVSAGSDQPPLTLGPTIIRRVASGYESAAADIRWLQLIQYIGTPSADRAGWPHLLRLINDVTDLDPQFAYAYQVGGALLSLRERYEESNAILQKGMANIPDRWQLPFAAAVNLYLTGGRINEIAELLTLAASLPGRPDYLPLLAARTWTSAERTELARAAIEEAIATTPAGPARERLVQRLHEISYEEDLRILERAVDRFIRANGRAPSSLAELIGQLPREHLSHPLSDFAYDPSTALVSSPKLPHRLKLAR